VVVGQLFYGLPQPVDLPIPLAQPTVAVIVAVISLRQHATPTMASPQSVLQSLDLLPVLLLHLLTALLTITCRQ
jgi:hypothetical protein